MGVGVGTGTYVLPSPPPLSFPADDHSLLCDVCRPFGFLSHRGPRQPFNVSSLPSIPIDPQPTSLAYHFRHAGDENYLVEKVSGKLQAKNSTAVKQSGIVNDTMHSKIDRNLIINVRGSGQKPPSHICTHIGSRLYTGVCQVTSVLISFLSELPVNRFVSLSGRYFTNM